ncbi:MAG: pH regulation protein F [Deltaproteobacteria bacterium]|nr:pH regulation protein F [Candidatus Anaeroferrophillus wilburensis]MBN2889096.1 pH regulation protein F [Deltaproteobacteria bacterium]
MEQFFLFISLFLCLLIFPCLYRVIWGPTIIDRMVAVGAIGTKTLVILVLMGFMYERIAMFIDISMVYAILNFVGTLAAARYFEGKGEI